MISKDPLDKSFRVSQFSYRYEKEKKKKEKTRTDLRVTCVETF